GGAIPDMADYDVVEFPTETFVGRVNEDFAIESLAGDIFLLGNNSWRIRRVSSGKVWVEDAKGLPPTIPFWLGESPGRTRELSRCVSELRREVAERLADRSAAIHWISAEAALGDAASAQILDYVAETVAMLGNVPQQQLIVAERFFDEAGGMQLVIHSPWGGRINRAWGMALRKRFCVSFDRELQAAATDDGIVLSLVEQHSFPLSDVFLMLRSAILDETLTQAVLPSPLFANRWRWNATRALALLRHSSGKKIPVALQRMRAEDLLTAVFPEQTMCQDNRAGPVEIPDHPLVAETLADCLEEAMDAAGLKDIVAGLGDGRISTLAVDTPAPSPMAHEILNANPYAFLDDAPLEERRARAVSLRRTDSWLGREFGRLDDAAIEEVRRQAWPDVRNAEELHDLLLSVGLMPPNERADCAPFAAALIGSGRASVARWSDARSGEIRSAWVAAERCDLLRRVLPEAVFDPPVALPPGAIDKIDSEEQAVRKIVHGWLETVGPTTAPALAGRLGVSAGGVVAALLSLESAGVVLRGAFTAAAPSDGEPETTEWCERGLLARIHRLTLGRLRREIEAVPAAEFMQFLFRWQHLAPGCLLTARDGVLRVIEQLQGLELPAPAWENQILPARVAGYDPADLEHLCLSGIVAWGRLKNGVDPQPEGDAARRRRRRASAPARNAPIAFVRRDDLELFLDGGGDWTEGNALSPEARDVAS
ncbi:MAG: DEAD/DEAH box helicase, partial [Alphaproteobacteria bacterium]